MPFRESPSSRLAFERVRRASVQYALKLRKIALHIGELIEAFPHPDFGTEAAIETLLSRYSKAIEPWAQQTASRMLLEVSRRDERAWAQYARRMGKAITREIAQAPTGELMRKALAAQVELITSLPLEAAKRVHELTIEGLSTSIRPEEIAKKILETGEVTIARANLIARTEVSRTASEFTEARAVSVGSTHYIWRTAKDARVRDAHMPMEGRICEWARAPEVEPGKFYHAGRIYNCRCYPEPIIPED